MRLPMPALVAGLAVAALGAAGLVRAAVPSDGGGTAAAPITITGAFVRAPAPPTKEAAAYFTVHNNTGSADRLVAVSTGAARESMLHQDVGGRMTMLMSGVRVPAHGELVLTAGQDHVMLQHLVGTMRAGQSVRLTLMFQRAGTVEVTAPVIAPGAPAPTTPGGTAPSGAAPSD
ncbi:MAG TPA: copper chaperone PCu(A)C [Jatrophihabitantaceae bacterium]|nr:copper chaperone PCu(A)C [Jatrophihabitantaceae bacterium]